MPVADVRLVAEAVMAQHLPDDRCLAEHGLLKSGVAGEVADLRARSAEGAETCASSGVVYRGARDERPVGWSDADWAGWWMLQPECGEASRAHIERILTGATDLARRGAALQAEVVRLRQALEGLAATPKHVPRTEEAACLQIEVASIARDALGSK